MLYIFYFAFSTKMFERNLSPKSSSDEEFSQRVRELSHRFSLSITFFFFFWFLRVGKLSRKYYVYAALLCFLAGQVRWRQGRWRTKITMCIVISCMCHTKIVYPNKGLCMCVSLLESKLYDTQVEAKCTHKPRNNDNEGWKLRRGW